MNRTQQPDRETLRRSRWQLWVLVAVVIFSTLAVTGVAFAQQNNSFDFACWSVSTGGGGNRAGTNYRVQDALVGGAAGSSTKTSNNYWLRSGFAQNMAFLKPGGAVTAAAPALTAAGAENANEIHLPLISRFILIKRTCPG